MGFPPAPAKFSWRDKMPAAETQGWAPFCVSFAASKLDEFFSKQAGTYANLSARWLAAASGTSKVGNSLVAVLDVLKAQGCVKDEVFPTGFILKTQPSNWDEVMDISKIPFTAKDEAKAYAIKGYAAIPSFDREYIKDALQKAPLLIAIGLGSTFGQRYTTTPVEQPKSYSVYHSVLLVGWDENDNWEIYDSLGLTSYYLNKNYELLVVFSVLDLPDDWNAKQKMASVNEFPVIESHYGQPRIVAAEQRAATDLQAAFKAFNNKSVYDAAGRFWFLYTNAVAYGGYTITDCVNDCYNWRRTGKHIWDFNKFRPVR